MLKNIFRSRKKSKGSQSTPSGKDTKPTTKTNTLSDGIYANSGIIILPEDYKWASTSNEDLNAVNSSDNLSDVHSAKSTNGCVSGSPTHRRRTLSSIGDKLKLGLSQSAVKPQKSRRVTASDLRPAGSFDDISRFTGRSQSVTSAFGDRNIRDELPLEDHIFAVPLPPSNYRKAADQKKPTIDRKTAGILSKDRHGSSPALLGGCGDHTVVAGSLPNLSGGTWNCVDSVDSDRHDFNENDITTPKGNGVGIYGDKRNSIALPLRTSTVCKEHTITVCCTPAGSTSLFPSPLRLCDLEKTPGEASDDTIPELVEVNSGRLSGQGNRDPVPAVVSTGSQSSPLSTSHQQPANVTGVANESEMYILTDSFLDDSPGSLLNGNNTSRFMSRSADSEVIVAYDSAPVTVSSLEGLSSLADDDTTATQPTSFPVPSPCWASSKPPIVPSSLRHRDRPQVVVPLSSTMFHSYHEKPLVDWTLDDVLAWVVDVGLGQFSDSFKRNHVVGTDLTVISGKFLDRLGIFGQEAREAVLTGLYKLHASKHSGQSYEAAFSVSVRKERVFPTRHTSTDSLSLGRQLKMSESTRIAKQLCFDETAVSSVALAPVTVEVRHSLNSAADCSSCFVAVSPSTKAIEVIRRVLQMNQDVTSDVESFKLMVVLGDGQTATNSAVELESTANVSSALLSHRGTLKFLELRLHPNLIDLRVVCMIDKTIVKPRLLQFQVPNTASVAGLFDMTLHFLQINISQADDYILATADTSKQQLRPVDKCQLVVAMTNQNFVLCTTSQLSCADCDWSVLSRVFDNNNVSLSSSGLTNTSSLTAAAAESQTPQQSSVVTQSVATNTENVPETEIVSVNSTDAELKELRAQVVELKETLNRKNLLIETFEKEKSAAVQESATPTGDSVASVGVYDLLTAIKEAGSIVAIDITKDEVGSLGFMFGVDNNLRPLVKHVEDGSKFKKADRFLEVNGESVVRLNESQLYKLLKASVTNGNVRTVVLRTAVDHKPAMSSEDIEALKEDLSLALMELETLQQENKDLNNELDRLRKINGEVVELN